MTTEHAAPTPVDQVRPVALAEWVSAHEQARAEGATFFDWLTAVDVTDSPEVAGFDLVTRLLDVSTPGRLPGIRLTTRVPLDATVASLTRLWPGAAWHERETFEMFGVEFSGFADHTDLGLRPLLLPDGFAGHPLRKSFVLASRATRPWPGGKEPGEGHAGAPSRRRVQAPGVPPPEWGPR